ncbi:hypothetical protein LCGC14_0376740 [marine sediment metagenome]|uniref:Uncharacterized protein n=1 Tax=marine sediment metagenome TaxID=412755 RepID=A0A0F9WC96_9ZZZZ
MAVDTETKRRSALGMLVMALTIAPVPDGTIAAVDREHITGIYAGIAPASPGVLTTAIHIFSETTVEPNHATDNPSSVLIADDLEVQGEGFFGSGSNYSQFEGDGTYVMKGAATVWNDLILPLSSARVPAANAPSWTSFIGNLNAYTYDVNDFQEFSTEIEHGYKSGSTFEFHIHGAVNGSNVDDRTIKFEIEYTIADTPAESGFGDVYPATTTINGELTIPAATTDLTAFSIHIGTDSTGSFVQGAIVNGRVRRITSTGTEPTGDPFLTEVGIHAEDDTIGSRTETAK